MQGLSAEADCDAGHQAHDLVLYEQQLMQKDCHTVWSGLMQGSSHASVTGHALCSQTSRRMLSSRRVSRAASRCDVGS